MRHPLREVSEEEETGKRGTAPADKTVPAAAARVQLNTINLSVTHGAKRRWRCCLKLGHKLVAHLMEKKRRKFLCVRWPPHLATHSLCPFLSTARHRNRHIWVRRPWPWRRRVASSPASASATPAPSQAQAEAVAVCPFDGESCLGKTSANKIAAKKNP